MKITRLRSLATLFFILVGTHFTTSIAVAQNTNTPGITIFTFTGERHTLQSTNDPLLLYVSLTDSASTSISRSNKRNQELRDSFLESDASQQLSKKELEAYLVNYPIIELPTFKLGSELSPLVNFIDIQIRNSNGESVPLNARSLSVNNDQQSVIQLDKNKSIRYVFAIDMQDLNSLNSGDYFIVAAVDTRNEKDMWQGWAYSNTVKVTLSSEHPNQEWATSNTQAMYYSTYLLSDKQFSEAEQHAVDWTKRHPNSVNAWSSLGDALAGQSKKESAMNAYETAMEKFFIKNGDTAQEAPRALMEKMARLEQD